MDSSAWGWDSGEKKVSEHCARPRLLVWGVIIISYGLRVVSKDERFVQGNPLGPLFSALTLSIIRKQINEHSEFRLLNNQQPNDDTLGSQTHTASIIDDTSAALTYYADIPFFLYKFTKLGKPLGIKLALAKTSTSSHLLLDPPPPPFYPHKIGILYK
jgi:hypothetical protein